MKFIPHEYQSYAIRFIKEHATAAVLLDMGLGKTVITLTAINDLMFDSFDVHKVLVIAPKRVAATAWPDEIEKWGHLRHLRYAVAVGSVDERIAALQSDADIYLINRENVTWLIDESGLPFDYDMIVIDELSSFKSSGTKRFRSLLRERPKVKRIVGLTGTPASNGLMDLWAEYRLLDMGERLGRFITHYRNAYFQPDRRNGMIVYQKRARHPQPQQRLRWHRREPDAGSLERHQRLCRLDPRQSTRLRRHADRHGQERVRYRIAVKGVRRPDR